MDGQTLDMLRAMFVGDILKHKEGKNLGVRIQSLDYNSTTDELELSVYYLPLVPEARYSARDALFLKFETFINSFSYWENRGENPDVTQAKWVPLTHIVELK
jgi:hypothetical protein